MTATTASARPFAKVLVANRGEIACRVIRTLRRLGVASVAVYSDADAGARHVHEADEAVRIGPAPAAQSYLSIPAIVEAARATGAEAVHPGYGFLSENAALARSLADAGIVFVGPGPEALAVMGDKIRAKNHVAGHGVPVIPGVPEPGLTDAELIGRAEGVGYPLLIKPSAGGGGKGMTVVESAADLPGALATARRVATAAFGDGTLLLERLVRAPRHIEVQVLADTRGTTIHLGERECSLQRRHQKVIEEAPSPLFDTEQGPDTRARIGAAACEAARSVGYVGAGTVEFLVSDEAPDDFFFMEMNTRLQVEHPVTEMVTGIDLVEQQLRVAAGEPLALRQEDLRLDGHAIEARVYAEVPARGFLPATGRIEVLDEPAGDRVRVDSSLEPGLAIGSDYDPMLAKCIAWGPTRGEALETLDAALSRYTVLGVETNIEYLRLLLADPDVRAGHLDTTLIERRLDGLAFRTPGEADYAAAALLAAGTAADAVDAAATGPWAADGWRLGAPAARRMSLGGPDGGVVTVAVHAPPAGAADGAGTVRVDVGSERGAPRGAGLERVGQAGVVLTLDGEEHRYSWALAEGPAGESTVHLGEAGWSTALPVLGRAERLERLRAAVHRHEGEAAPEVRTPMPGTVVSVAVDHGQAVEAGQPLVSVEAMKMEHQLVAAFAGTVALHVTPGALVKADQVVATVTPHHEAPQRDAHEGA
ncbi:biotin carboxylase N-terminal domain-containing protein [Sinomonas atrocyanea]|uniref:acetyl/propionyl/methylcrotonyl-CoA carboxylase subunit alpha n=1 Tax=Sinomonas atrocyanea TaxID=37927 RepID=UPI0027897AFB|nr:biotin carboxylase N-terminal domain-containing protein [Sinomonas atrocyanea]MDQ0259733.1 acetyl-CoA/propionyl-CoA carboxylase biotin carboxyl carrier protein [Sinomonas atrocyanea]MDR6621698.1 acetyl-CoA/propionyl-CoA carboxylase biotin carboxyl carrier protein [Sinomonas atrocyanea]